MRESSFTRIAHVFLFVLVPLVGVITLPVVAGTGDENVGLSIGVWTVLLSTIVAYGLWLRVRRLSDFFKSLIPLKQSDFKYVLGKEWGRTVKSVRLMRVVGGLLVLPAVWYGVSRGPSGWVLMSAIVTCLVYVPVIFGQLVPVARDLRSRAIHRGQFRRIASVRSVDSFWTVFSILLCLTPFYVLVVVAPHFHLSNALIRGVEISTWLMTIEFKALLTIPVVGFLGATVAPWVIVWGTRSIVPLLTIVATGILSLFLRAFIPWLGFLVAFTVVWDGIVASRGHAAGRRLWIVASGIAAGFLSLALGIFLQFWGVGGINLPAFLVGLAFALVLDTSLQRWDT